MTRNNAQLIYVWPLFACMYNDRSKDIRRSSVSIGIKHILLRIVQTLYIPYLDKINVYVWMLNVSKLVIKHILPQLPTYNKIIILMSAIHVLYLDLVSKNNSFVTVSYYSIIIIHMYILLLYLKMIIS